MLTRPPDPRRAATRARQRRYLRRVESGLVVVPVECDGAILTMLIATGWLREAHADDRAKVGDAIARLLADASSE
jgi:hypothetical protein